MTDEEAVRYLDEHRAAKKFLSVRTIPKDILNHLLERYDDIDCWQESWYRIKNHIDARPVCPICGGRLKFNHKNMHFLLYCSRKCSGVSEERKQHQKETCIREFGVDNYAKTQEFADLNHEMAKNRTDEERAEMHRKYIETSIKHFGVYSYMLTEEGKRRYEETCMKRFGAKNWSQSEIGREHLKEVFANRTEEEAEAIVKKTQETNVQRYGAKNWTCTEEGKARWMAAINAHYGVNTPMESEEIRKRVEETCIEKYGVKNYAMTEEYLEKWNAALQEHYGVNTPMECEEIRKRMEDTCIERFGNKNFVCSEEYKTRIDEIQKKMQDTCEELYGERFYSKTEEYKRKNYETKRKNNSFNRSNPEDEFYNRLIKVYPDAVRQYKCDKYPYACDFYVPSEDLFIELNYFWTHQKHPFNPDSQEDNETLMMLYEKNTKFYNNAIYVWIVLDVKKFACAEQHSLNYLAFYSKEEGNAWLDSIGA